MRRVQSQAIVCGRFVPVLLCWKRARAGAAGGAGAAAGCASGAERRGRCGPGNGERARAPAARAEAAESVRLGDSGEASPRAQRGHQWLTDWSRGAAHRAFAPLLRAPSGFPVSLPSSVLCISISSLPLAMHLSFLLPAHCSFSVSSFFTLTIYLCFLFLLDSRLPLPCLCISIPPALSTTSGAPRLGATAIRNQALCSWFGKGPWVGGCAVGSVSQVHKKTANSRDRNLLAVRLPATPDALGKRFGGSPGLSL